MGLVSISYLFFGFPPLHGEASRSWGKQFPYTLSVAALEGFLYGQGEEIVYKDADTDTYYSQLLWDMKPLWYAGASLDFSRSNPLEGLGFFSTLTLKFGIPTQTGTMEDRDWLADNGALTNFSSHANYTQGALLLNLSRGISVPLAARVVLKLYWSLSYMAFSWASQDGFLQYAEKKSDGTYEPWDESLPKTPIYGPAIAYSQRWLIIAPGLAVQVPLSPGFIVAASFQISPFIWCCDQDDHFSRSIQFIDQTAGGIFLEPQVAVTVVPLPNLNLSLYGAYRYISGSRGDTEAKNTTTGKLFFRSTGMAGTGYAALDLGLALKIRL
ncbi:MAG: omptin family outer membrane protease [Treponema sp.]|nr:omptin family outer membrane protease [Treponema sp.]